MQNELQVLALCVCPDLLNNAAALKGFSADAITRAKTYLKAIPGGTGAYSNSQGVQVRAMSVIYFYFCAFDFYASLHGRDCVTIQDVISLAFIAFTFRFVS